MLDGTDHEPHEPSNVDQSPHRGERSASPKRQRPPPPAILHAGGSVVVRDGGETARVDIMPLSARYSPLRTAGLPPRDRFRLSVVRRAEDLAGHVEAWEDLARSAIEPNAFYEPWMLLPAIELLGPFPGQAFVLVYAPSVEDPRKEVLCGFFPLQDCRTETRVPLAACGFLRHPFCYLRTPLLRLHYAQDCLAVFLDWMFSKESGVSLFELGELPGEGPLQQLLINELRSRGTLTFQQCLFTRALFRPAADADAYLQGALTPRHRRDYGRKLRRLGDEGPVRFETLGPDGDVDKWIHEFLSLEASGWKGSTGTALACKAATQAFFERIMRAAFERKRLLTLTLRVGDRPIAMRMSFLSGKSAMAFKIAYAEDLARHSPGALLEVENIRRLHAAPRLEWMDCGAIPESNLFNHLWRHRRTIETTIVGSSTAGNLLVSVLPLARLLSRLVGVSKPHVAPDHGRPPASDTDPEPHA
jgi:hypothetical protein